MHLKKVAVPVRLKQDHIGQAIVLAARVRPKFIGGERAIYNEELKNGYPDFDAEYRKHRFRGAFAALYFLRQVSSPFSASSTSVLPAGRSPRRISFAISVSAALWR